MRKGTLMANRTSQYGLESFKIHLRLSLRLSLLPAKRMQSAKAMNTHRRRSIRLLSSPINRAFHLAHFLDTKLTNMSRWRANLSSPLAPVQQSSHGRKSRSAQVLGSV